MFVRSTSLAVVSLLLLRAGVVHGADSKSPPTDLYGDPLPPGVVARLGTIRLRHADADVVFSQSGKRLISCGADGEVRVWNAADGKLVQRSCLECGTRRYSRVILSPGGSKVAAVQGGHLILHDAETGMDRGQIDIVERALVRFSPDGAALVVEVGAEDGSRHLAIWDVERVKKRQKLADVSLACEVIECAFSRGGKRLAGFTSERDKIFFWDAQTGQLLDQKEAGGDRTVEALAFSPDGKTLAVGWGPAWSEPAQVQLLDAATYRTKTVLPVPLNIQPKIFGKLAFSPDGRLLAGSYANDRRGLHGILLWDVASAKMPKHLPERRYATFTFSPDGKTLACHDPTGSAIRLWGSSTGRQRFDYPQYDRPAKTIVGSPNGKLIAAEAGDEIYLWDAVKGQFLRSLKQESASPARCLFLPDNERMICIEPGNSPALQEWEFASGKKRRRFEFPAPFRVVHGLGISADGKRLAGVVSNGEDVTRTTQLFIWDASTAERLNQRPFKCDGRVGAHFALPTVPVQTPMTFAPDGEAVLRMWNEKTLQPGEEDYWRGLRLGLEDVATGLLVAELPKGVGLPVVFSPNGRLLAAPVFAGISTPGHSDSLKGLSLIEAASGEELFPIEPGEFDYFAFTPEGDGLLAVNKNGVRVWDTETARLLHEMKWPDSVGIVHGEAKIHALAVLPGGRLATAMKDGDILVWDLSAEKWPRPKLDIERKPLEALWADLLRDPRTAQKAVRALAAEPEPAVAFLIKRLPPLVIDRAEIDKLLADLDSDSFSARETANRNLARLRDRVMPRLRQVLQEKPSLELRLRIEALLAEPKRLPTDSVRVLRAIDVLEHIGTPEARRILVKLTTSAATVEARMAQTALLRMHQRDASAKKGFAP
ncbi:MAG TPA: WD40 repeat domain-containing protein [Gemmataceae bacterium]|nr:WD40 repeat domain-containing protein [Gemmataceae bacterium]